VTIYFDTVTTRRIAEQFYAALTPGGWLLVGHSEPQASTYHQFETHNFPNAIFYRKALDAPLFPISSPGTASSKPAAASAKHSDLRQVPPLTPPATRQRDTSPLLPGKREQQPATPKNRRTTPLPAVPLPPKPATRPRETQPAAHAAANDVWSGIMSYLAQGKKRDAELLLTSLLRDAPDHLGALVTLGRLYADRGDWAAAQRLCEQALASQPLSLEASYLLAQIHEHEDHLDDAIAAYRRVIYIDRTFIPGLLGMANVWRRLNRLSEARRTYRNLLRHLATLPASSVLHDVDDVTVQELIEFVNRQLAALS
jgi:chemotaxis protein methyltransferase CheR